MRLTAVLTSAALLFSAPVFAQSVKIEFRDGKVDLLAQNATIRAILQEWGRQGGTRIVNGERVPGAPVTLDLTGVYEREALEILLRGAAGYVVGQRQASSEGASIYDRIMILPTSNVVRSGAPVGGQPLSLGPQQVRAPVNVNELEDEPEDSGPVPPANRNGRPAPRVPPGVRQRVLEQAPQGGVPAPGSRERLQQIIEEDLNEEAVDEEARPLPTPQNPFGVVPGSTRPGVIAPVPQPSPQRPGQEQR